MKELLEPIAQYLQAGRPPHARQRDFQQRSTPRKAVRHARFGDGPLPEQSAAAPSSTRRRRAARLLLSNVGCRAPIT
jgi:hypothetical protein